MKIAYVLDLFPVTSETFILNEIVTFRRNGNDILIFSLGNPLTKPFGKIVHKDAEALLKETHYFPTLKSGKILFNIFLNIIFLLINHPVRFFKTFYFSIENDKIISRTFLHAIYFSVYMERKNIEHIHAHFALNACKQAMFISMLTGIEYSFIMHAHDIFIKSRSDLMVEKFQHAKFVASISEFNKDFIIKKYPAISPDKIKIIHCGIDITKIEPQDKGKTQRFTILSIGRLVEHKGFKFLIAACHILKTRFKLDFICKIIGEGEDRAELEELISNYGLNENVFLVGAKKHDEVISLFKNANLFVLPCVVDRNDSMDGIPVALMEAMAMQKPVISTKISGIPELINSDCGMLVEPEDSEGLAQAINKFYELPVEKRNELGKNGRNIVEKSFNLSTETEKLATLMKN